jgi:hypothetical protein
MAANIFTRKKKVSSKLTPLESLGYTLHTLSTLPLKGFIDCYCNNNFNSLLIKGQASLQALEGYFQSLKIEYYDLLGTAELKKYVVLNMELIQTKFKIENSITLMRCYIITRDERTVDLLSHHLYFFDKKWEEDRLVDDFNAFINDLQVDYKNITKKIQREFKEDDSVEKATLLTFLKNIVAMNQANYKADINMMTDSYAVTFNMYNEELKLKSEANA